jgi:CheY-like chemotaxis protein
MDRGGKLMLAQEDQAGRRCRALVVDDDEEIRHVLEEALAEEGYAVRAVADGSAALETLRSEPGPWVVVLDLMMPQTDGQETLRFVADDPALRNGNAFILTTAGGRTLPLALVRLLDELGVAYLAKPFDLDMMLSIVERAAARLEGRS